MVSREEASGEGWGEGGAPKSPRRTQGRDGVDPCPRWCLTVPGVVRRPQLDGFGGVQSLIGDDKGTLTLLVLFRSFWLDLPKSLFSHTKGSSLPSFFPFFS